MELAERLKSIRQLSNVSQEQFASIIGVSKKAYWNYESGKRNIPTDILLNIARLYQINTNWLFTGKGRMLLTENTIDDIAKDIVDKNAETLEYIHINPSCGSGTICVDEPEITPITLGTELIKNVLKIANPKNLKIFKASGDSMEPTIYNDDILIVDIGNKDYINGGVFIINKNNDFFCKRLQLKINGNLDIISDNSKYQVETIKKDNDYITLTIVGKVLKNLSHGL